MTAQLDFFFSSASRYSYLASTQIAGLVERTGCRVNWRPVNGPDIRQLRGSDPLDGSMVSGQYELAYRKQDAEAWAEFYDVPFIEPKEFDFDYRLAARAAAAGQLMNCDASFWLALSHEIFGTGSWPVDEALMIDVAAAHALSKNDFGALLGSEQVAEVLKDNAQEAFERGAFGVPTFFVGDRMFWGNDRLTLVEHALRAK